jgi:PrtD family type I secretion system ABC transporter
MPVRQRNLYERCMSQIRRQMLTLGVFSFAANLLLLVSSIYMLQVFDRVLSSGSTDTLFWLTVVAVFAIVVYGVLELARRRLLSRTGAWLETELSAPVVRRCVDARLSGIAGEAGLADVQEVRTFLGGDAILAFFDAPWMPIFIGVIWLLHPALGLLAAAGAVALFLVAIVNDRLTRRNLLESRAALHRNQRAAEQYIDHAETVRALGMLGPLLELWQRTLRGIRAETERNTAVTHGLTSLTKSARLALQILMLGSGAWLVLQGELTGGGMIAASIILSRALSPVERALGAWRGYVSARSASNNLSNLFQAIDRTTAGTALPDPTGALTIENLVFQPPQARTPIIKRINLQLEAGLTCGIIGPSGSGKSTLCRLIVGAWKPNLGYVRLDEADVSRWDPDQLGRHVGYLAQTVELFPGTIAQNIARMRKSDDADVIEAAKLADVHDMILHMPDGYNTDLGLYGQRLSGGQKQRIGLARAVFGDPALIVLDEPSSNLDSQGEQALQRALARLKELGRTVLIVAHQPRTLRTADKVLVLREGTVAAFGERDEVLRSLMRRPTQQRVAEIPGSNAGSADAEGTTARTQQGKAK